jgi:lipopolysaccharide/colanic/teichoic acid biosynthesis glycosyltransferase
MWRGGLYATLGTSAYIDNWSLELDIKLLLRTIPRALTEWGAH